MLSLVRPESLEGGAPGAGPKIPVNSLASLNGRSFRTAAVRSVLAQVVCGRSTRPTTAVNDWFCGDRLMRCGSVSKKACAM